MNNLEITTLTSLSERFSFFEREGKLYLRARELHAHLYGEEKADKNYHRFVSQRVKNAFYAQLPGQYVDLYTNQFSRKSQTETFVHIRLAQTICAIIGTVLAQAVYEQLANLGEGVLEAA